MSSSFKKAPDTPDVRSETTSSDRSSHEQAVICFAQLHRKLLWLKTAVTIGLIAGLTLSPKLWLSARFYPLTPVWRVLKPLPFPFDYAVFGSALLSLVFVALVRRPLKAIALFVSLAVLLALFDQSRWQPWFYQYVFMLISIALAFRTQTNIVGHEKALNLCRLIMVSIYFWSGLQKLNRGFVEDVFPWLIQPVTHVLPATIVALLVRLGIVVPFVELGIGVMLLSRRFRAAGVILAVSMHFFILLAVGPWGQNRNTVIWSWNIVMACCVVILFGSPSEFRVRDLLWPQKAVFHYVVLILFTVAPALSFFRLWDNYLSWALYAGNKNDATVLMTDAVDEKLPDEIEQYATDEGADLNNLVISNWSYGELNVPPYPEIRIYRNVARTICTYADKPTDVKLIIQNKIALVGERKQRTYDCSSLTDQ